MNRRVYRAALQRRLAAKKEDCAMLTAIYARKSTDQNGVSDEEKSVTRQVEHAKAYAVKQ